MKIKVEEVLGEQVEIETHLFDQLSNLPYRDKARGKLLAELGRVEGRIKLIKGLM